MGASLHARLASFWRDKAANVAISFTLTLLPVATGVAGGVDYTRAASIGAEIQSALDTGVLAAASLTQDRDPEAVVRAYVEAALAEHDGLFEALTVTVNAETGLNARRVNAIASVNVPTLMLGIAGVSTLPVTRSSEAIEEIRDIEISLVLDVSGSMDGSKIRALRDAATEFIDVVLNSDRMDRTSVSVIPYNGGVRTPAALNRALTRDTINQTGCLDLGDDDPQRIALANGALDPIEWNGNDLVGARRSSFCPGEDMASMFLGSEAGPLQGLIGRLRASGFTGLDVATSWGARALDPAWRGRLGGAFADRPADYDDPETIKVLVIMTDGRATEQERTRWRNGGWQTYRLYNARRARTNMAEACDAAAANGVQVYTIAFQLSGSTHRRLMEDCASKSENFYSVESLDISAAFSAIAADINQLRLSS